MILVRPNRYSEDEDELVMEIMRWFLALVHAGNVPYFLSPPLQ
jgi:hypothetical protein